MVLVTYLEGKTFNPKLNCVKISNFLKTCFDGCALDRPTDVYISKLPYWEPIPADGRDTQGKQVGVWSKPDEEEEHLWWHQIGRFIKRPECISRY